MTMDHNALTGAEVYAAACLDATAREIIRELVAEYRTLKREHDHWQRTCAQLTADNIRAGEWVQELKEQAQQLADAVLDYGWHQQECPARNGMGCICGYTEARALASQFCKEAHHAS